MPLWVVVVHWYLACLEKNHVVPAIRQSLCALLKLRLKERQQPAQTQSHHTIQLSRCVIEDVTDKEGVTLKRGVRLTEVGLLAFAELPEDLLSLLACR